jgi:hypothetical protein
MEEELNAIQLLENFLEERRIFWEVTYHTLSLDERKKVWYQDVYNGMRRQPEETQDPYDTFSKEWYDFAKKIEPNFDDFLVEIIDDLDRSYFIINKFDWEEYRKRILK